MYANITFYNHFNSHEIGTGTEQKTIAQEIRMDLVSRRRRQGIGLSSWQQPRPPRLVRWDNRLNHVRVRAPDL